MIKGKSLDQQLKERMQTTGKLSSADVAAVAETEEAPATGLPQGDVTSVAPASEYKEPLVPVSPISPDGSKLAERASTGSQTEGMNDDIEVRLTEEERAIFLDAIVSNSRFVLPFTIFNGKVNGLIRSRTQAETRAIISQLQREIRETSIQSDADYTLRLRSMLMAAQIAEYNGATNPELTEPLMPVRQPDGKDKPQGWLAQALHWQDLDEALATALYEEIRKFEVKYWMMARHAADQNFWRTAASS